MAQRVRCLLQKHKDLFQTPPAVKRGKKKQVWSASPIDPAPGGQEAETGGSRGPGQVSAFPEVTIATNQFQNVFLLKEKPGG